MAFVEIGRISSKHVRVTVASPKGAQTPRGITAPPTQAATPLNNHVSAPMDESAKPVLADEEMPADHVEAMDTREGKSEWVYGITDYYSIAAVNTAAALILCSHYHDYDHAHHDC